MDSLPLSHLGNHLAHPRYSLWRRKWQPTPVFLPGKPQWTEEPGTLCPWGCEESDTTERIHFHFSLSCIGEGKGNPLQCSCLENPRDGGAWWAAVYGVTQSRTQLKRLSSSSRYSLKGCGGTSLMVQWLRISLITQQTWVRSPH